MMKQYNLAKVNEVVDAEVAARSHGIDTLDCIHIMATIQIVVPDLNYSNNLHYMEKQLSIINEQNKEIKRLNRQLQKKRVINPEFATTEEAAYYIRVDPSYLTKRKFNTFKLGIHFFKPKGETIIRWSLPALSKWLTEEGNNNKNITPKLAKLLERS